MSSRAWLSLSTAVVLALALVTWSCEHWSTPTQPESVPSDLEIAADTALFSALVRTLLDSLPEPGRVSRNALGQLVRVSTHPLRVDPRPLVKTVKMDSLANVPPEVVAARAEVLARLGVPEYDVHARGRCAYWITMGNASPEEREDLGRDCPQEIAYLTVIAGIPRFGDAPWSNSPEERAEEARLGHWSIMVIKVPMTPSGISKTYADYVFKRSEDGKGWQFVEERGLLAYD